MRHFLIFASFVITFDHFVISTPLCNPILRLLVISKAVLLKLICIILQCFFVSQSILQSKLTMQSWVIIFPVGYNHFIYKTIKRIHYSQSVLIFPDEDLLCRVQRSYFQLFISTLSVRTTILDVYKASKIRIVFSSKQQTSIWKVCVDGELLLLILFFYLLALNDWTSITLSCVIEGGLSS